MALLNKLVNWNELIKFSSSGILIAEYPQIRTSISRRFREIYGDDIDLSTASADGVYVETLCLMINNILKSFQSFYTNLDINTATGKFLEILCSLSNVNRKPATYSNASITVTLGSDETEYTTNSISFLDKNGNIWTCESIEPLVFQPGVAQQIVVICETPGPIKAEAGWIDRLVETNINMTISQTQQANVGSYEETDSQLRARRNQSLGASGTTVLESLAGALLSITGIDDVKIYNNDTASAITAKDTTSIPSHNVYVIIRKKTNIDITDATIGSIIYEKMTPGIQTQQMKTEVTSGTSKNFIYEQYVLGTPISGVTQNVYWKEAKALNPTINITLDLKEHFASANDSTVKLIASAALSYLNNLPLSTNISISELKNVIEDADPLFRGRSTYDINTLTIDNKQTDFVNIDTYFNYTSYDTDTDQPNQITIHLT